MTQKNWIGRYGYSFEDDTQYYSFEILADYKNGSFEGHVYEEEFSGFTSDHVHVKGFIELDMISFVKTYPYFYAIDEFGKIIIDKNKRGHQVVYEGYLNQETGAWTGHWEIVTDEEEVHPGIYREHFFSGPWEMKLKGSL